MIRWLIVAICVFVAAGVSALATYEGSPVRAWLEQAEGSPNDDLMSVGGLAPWEADAEGLESVNIEPLSVLPVNEVPLHEQHRTAGEIAEWLTEVVTESLTFGSGDYSLVVQRAASYFHPSGYQQYLEFLQKGKVEETLASGDLRMTNFVQDTPFLLTKGSVDDRYKWLFEVPVMMTYSRGGRLGYGGQNPVSSEVTINIQIGRYNEAGADGLLIESFTVRPKAAR